MTIQENTFPIHHRLAHQLKSTAPGSLGIAAAAAAESLQLCPTLCDPIDGSPPGSRVPGILQARTLEWAAIAFPIRHCYSPTKFLYVEQKPTFMVTTEFYNCSLISQQKTGKTC